MKKLTALIWMLLIVGAAFLLYTVKDEVQSLQSQIAQVKEELDQETEGLNVAAAEWEYLNRPERLSHLSAKYLATSGTSVEQIAVVEAIPYPKQLETSIPQASNVQPVQFRTEAGGRR